MASWCRSSNTASPVSEQAVHESARHRPASVRFDMEQGPALTAAMAARNITIPQLRPEGMLVRLLGGPGNPYPWLGHAVRQGLPGVPRCVRRGREVRERSDPAERIDSPAGMPAALWNHTMATAPAPGGGKAPWRTFQSQKMADLIVPRRVFDVPSEIAPRAHRPITGRRGDGPVDRRDGRPPSRCAAGRLGPLASQQQPGPWYCLATRRALSVDEAPTVSVAAS